MTVFTVIVIIQNYTPTRKQSNKHIKNKIKMKKLTTIKVTVSDSKVTLAFNHLTKDDLQRIITEERINRKRALEIAAVYNLVFEVKLCMDFCGMSPIEALAEWDLL